MVSENQQQEFELLTDDDDWSDSLKPGKRILYGIPMRSLLNQRPADGETNLTLNELRIILVAISKIDSMNPEVRGDASYWVSAKELREIGSERSKAINTSRTQSIRFTTEALSAPSDPTVKNEMSSVGFLRSLIEAA